MFPIKSGDAYIKETGERSTLGAIIKEAGGSDLPEYGVGDAGKILAVDNEGDLKWETPAGSDLPEYDVEDAGKLLGVDNEGLLEWKTLSGGTKIYYKEYSLSFGTTENLAKFSDNAASAGSFNIAIIDSSTRNVTVNGYTPISAVAHDVSTGYSVGILLDYQVSSDVPQHQLSFVIANRNITSNAIKARVFYVKNEDLAALT